MFVMWLAIAARGHVTPASGDSRINAIRWRGLEMGFLGVLVGRSAVS